MYVQQMLNWEQFWNLRMGASLSGGRGIVAASSGLNVGGPPNEGISRPIELSTAPADTLSVW